MGTGCAAKRDWALLNCSHTDEAGRVAELVVRVPPGSYPDQNGGLLRVGAITETSTSCFVEVDATRTELCYEWIGHGASLDSFSAPRESNRTLDYDTFRGFGYDAEPEVTP